jgi:hypothetical protein
MPPPICGLEVIEGNKSPTQDDPLYFYSIPISHRQRVSDASGSIKSYDKLIIFWLNPLTPLFLISKGFSPCQNIGTCQIWNDGTSTLKKPGGRNAFISYGKGKR